MSASPLNLLLAGSSAYTLQLAKILRADARFRVTGVVTPAPQPVGRQKILTPSPVQLWAEAENLPIILIPEKIDQSVKKFIIEHNYVTPCDILLVVDFGYFVPNWLLKLPRIGPVNVHPSRLPRWRGSSPAQRVLLAGEPTSAVSVITMSDGLDEGDILAQLPFEVDPTWNAQQYYEFAFNLLAPQLGTLLTQFANGELAPQTQPLESPTSMAARLTKNDSYVPWEWLAAACGLANSTSSLVTELPVQAPPLGLLQDLAADLATPARAQLFAQASRAFSPWPKLWTLAPTTKGWQRLIIWQAHFDPQTQKIHLDQVQLEGKNPAQWNEVKNNWKPA